MSEDHSTTSHYDLLGTVIHDLKTPISSIKSYADLISHGGELNERQERYLERIHIAISNMTNLVNDLLDLVWIEGDMEIVKQPCNLLEIAQTQVQAHEGLAEEKGVTIHLNHNDNLKPIVADERRIHQVLDNLISNGLKYSKQGGNVWITITLYKKTVKVSVRDDGIGISPDDLPHVFERFFRASRREAAQIEGSGLGLSIAKAIVKRHSGKIGVTSELDKGSTFWFSLPLT